MNLCKHGGKVELIHCTDDDLVVVNSARVSFNKESIELDDGDKRLLDYLARHDHWTPFSQPQLRFRIKAPIFVARQWFKHTIGVTRNEVSRRYVDYEPDFWKVQEWRGRPDKSMKQGSGDILDLVFPYPELMEEYKNVYNKLIEKGVCPEQARMVLPQSMMTEWIETGSLYYYARLCNLRLDKHAQKEIQWYAEEVSQLVAAKFPHSWRMLIKEY